MHLRQFFSWCLGFFFIITTASAAVPEHQSYRLDNGLQVIVVRESRAPLVVTQVWYRVGSIDEPDGQTGISHMLEHMMFQGTDTVAPGQYSKRIARLGGTDNAATSRDYTFYYSKLAKQHLSVALEMEADRMRFLKLQNKEFQPENNVVQEERRMRVDNNPHARIREQYTQELYRGHSYSQPIIGWMKDVQGLTVEQLQAWYQRFYAPNNATLVIAGDVDFAQTKKYVQQFFGPLQADAAFKPPVDPQWQAPTTKRTYHYQDQQIRRPSWMANWLVPSNQGGDNQDEVYALKLALQLLNGGISNRLQKLTQGEGKLVSAGASYSMFSRGPSSFGLYAMPQKEVSMATVEQMVMAEITKLAEKPASAAELRKVKNGLLASQIYARDSVQGMANVIGRLSTLGLDWERYYAEFEQRIEQVTPEQIQNAVRRYLRADQVVIGITTPQQKPASKEQQG
ncbi:M16 family metallopeptidase [Magnetococcus sp. PR-3]|uniref:M16 family metallopeptidase n=1 Tax=Magnetococcus sp. PR-3 TaxID=3120355 RepID=UPI002FCE103F